MIEKSIENLKNEELINFSLDKINSFLDQKDQNKKLFEYLKDLHNADIADIREKITININSVEIPEREEKAVN